MDSRSQRKLVTELGLCPLIEKSHFQRLDMESGPFGIIRPNAMVNTRSEPVSGSVSLVLPFRSLVSLVILHHFFYVPLFPCPG